jgi:membrane associated rhomboid family serine protease
MNWFSNLYQNYLSRSIVEKLIVINIFLFVLTYLFNTLSFLFGIDQNLIVDWFSLQPDFGVLLYRPWTILSYGFLHIGFFHILFNLLFLYYFGNLFLNFFNPKQFLAYYLLGIISGGLIYMLAYNYLPALKTQETLLVGASAGVTAIVIGISTHIPQYALQFRFIGRVKLLYIAVGMVVLDLVQIPAGNAGGHLAHLGGAFLGFMMTRYFHQGTVLINWVDQMFRPKEKTPLKTVYKRKNKAYQKTSNKNEEQAKIDSILDKIIKSG